MPCSYRYFKSEGNVTSIYCSANSGVGLFQIDGLDVLLENGRCDFSTHHNCGTYTYDLLHAGFSFEAAGNDGMNCVGKK